MAQEQVTSEQILAELGKTYNQMGEACHAFDIEAVKQVEADTRRLMVAGADLGLSPTIISEAINSGRK